MFGAAAGRDKRIFHREFKRACSFSVKKSLLCAYRAGKATDQYPIECSI